VGVAGTLVGVKVAVRVRVSVGTADGVKVAVRVGVAGTLVGVKVAVRVRVSVGTADGVKVAVRVGVAGTLVDVKVAVEVFEAVGSAVGVKVAVAVPVDSMFADVEVAVAMCVGVGNAVRVNVRVGTCAAAGLEAAVASSASRVATWVALLAICTTKAPKASAPRKRCFSPVFGRSTTPFTAPSSATVTRTMNVIGDGSFCMEPRYAGGVTRTSRARDAPPVSFASASANVVVRRVV
jgi:hypothetical protein